MGFERNPKYPAETVKYIRNVKARKTGIFSLEVKAWLHGNTSNTRKGYVKIVGVR